MTEASQLIKNRRLEAGLTQVHLAKLIGVSPVFINQVERGVKSWPRKRADEICKILLISRDIFDNATLRDFEEKLK